MGQMSELDIELKELKEKARELVELADAIAEKLSGPDVKPAKKEKANPEPKAEEPAKEISLSDVKAVLMDKARAGFNEEVHELIKSYGEEKLSAIDSSCYPELMKKAEELGNG